MSRLSFCVLGNDWIYIQFEIATGLDYYIFLILLLYITHRLQISNIFSILPISFQELFKAILSFSYSNDDIINNIRPRINLWWYLTIEAFSDYSNYFNILFRAQPLLFCIPIYIRFVRTSQDNLCTTTTLTTTTTTTTTTTSSSPSLSSSSSILVAVSF